MNILVIDSHLKDGQFIIGYFSMLGHQCDWLKQVNGDQPTKGVLSGKDSGYIDRDLSLEGYNLALIESNLFSSGPGLEIALRLAECNIVRIAVGGVEKTKKLIKQGVFNFVVNRSTFYVEVEQVIAAIGDIAFEAKRKESNLTLIAKAGKSLGRKIKNIRRKATI